MAGRLALPLRACRGLISMFGRLGQLDRSVWLERSVASPPLTRALPSVLSPAAQKEDGRNGGCVDGRTSAATASSLSTTPTQNSAHTAPTPRPAIT